MKLTWNKHVYKLHEDDGMWQTTYPSEVNFVTIAHIDKWGDHWRINSTEGLGRNFFGNQVDTKFYKLSDAKQFVESRLMKFIKFITPKKSKV